jgi:hypothetical protein
MVRMNPSSPIGVRRLNLQDDQQSNDHAQASNCPAAAAACRQWADQLEVTALTELWRDVCAELLPWLFLISVMESRAISGRDRSHGPNG